MAAQDLPRDLVRPSSGFNNTLKRRRITKPPIYKALTVTFIEQSNIHFLDTCEDKYSEKRKHDPSSCEIIKLFYLGFSVIFPFRFGDLF